MSDAIVPETSPQPVLSDVSQQELLAWLSEKIADSERALKAREDAAAVWRIGTNAEWAAASALHPSTVGRSAKKRERLAIADREKRIAEKLRRDLKMFDALSAVLRQPDPEEGCEKVLLR
jgi:hypothetical protein